MYKCTETKTGLVFNEVSSGAALHFALRRLFVKYGFATLDEVGVTEIADSSEYHVYSLVNAEVYFKIVYIA